jgi:hypothetical protein
MTIETKYNIGDEVWAIVDNKPTKCRVGRIDTVHIGLSSSISYFLLFDQQQTRCERKEAFIYPTEEELLKSL